MEDLTLTKRKPIMYKNASLLVSLPAVRRFLMRIACLTLFFLLTECILKGESHHRQLV